MAHLKLLGGLVRLDALQPDGFTAAQLTKYARVEHETARAFLNPDKGPGFAEAIPQPKPSEGRGRPANLYRIRAARRDELYEQLAAVRRELDAVAGAPSPSRESDSELWDLLDETISQLERRTDPSEIWEERLGEARLELRAVEAEFRAMAENSPERAVTYVRRFEGLLQRLAEVERMGPPIEAAAAKVKNYLEVLVEQFGEWAGHSAALLEPTVLLLNGIRGQGRDRVASAIVQAYQTASVCVATFDIAGIDAGQRAKLFSVLDQLRTATPLAVSDFVLAVDGRTSLGKELATEFKRIGQIGAWQRLEEASAEDVVGVELNELRRFYRSQDGLVGPDATGAEGARAAYVATTVSVCATVDETAEVLYNDDVQAFEERGGELLNAAHRLMGNVVCIDASHNEEIEQAFAGEGVSYVKDALQRIPDDSLVSIGPYAKLYAIKEAAE